MSGSQNQRKECSRGERAREFGPWGPESEPESGWPFYALNLEDLPPAPPSNPPFLPLSVPTLFWDMEFAWWDSE